MARIWWRLFVVAVLLVEKAGAGRDGGDAATLEARRNALRRRLVAMKEKLAARIRLDEELRGRVRRRPRKQHQRSKRRRGEGLTEEEREGVKSGELCKQRSRVGGPRAVPSFAVIEWRGGKPGVEGMSCEVAERGRVCCRPTSETLSDLNIKNPAYFRTIERLSRSSGGVAESLRCFPSLIVAGAQKCGSTALTGYLMNHPHLHFGRQKELHYFDKNESQCTGALPYLAQFPQGYLATAEATPFYLADPFACSRIHAQLPHAKLVILVREPVSRARSEYEMKYRRVEAQDDFVSALSDRQISSNLLECLVSVGPRNVSAGLTECAPKRLRDSARFPLFRTSLVKRLRDSDDFGTFLKGCFRSGGNATKEDNGGVVLDARIAERVFGRKEAGAAEFDVDVCFPAGIRERLSGEFGAVLKREIQDLRECATSRFPSWQQPDPPTLADAADLLDSCVRVHTGISIQYVYRGLYAAQLARCTRSVDFADILIIESDELRHHPQSQLDYVADHVGLSRFSYDPALFQTENLRKAIREKYPTFENSGWQLATSYREPLPSGLTKELRAFFRPHNHLLFKLIGRHFPHWEG